MASGFREDDDDPYMDIPVDEVIRSTDDATLLKINGKSIWVPKSVIFGPHVSDLPEHEGTGMPHVLLIRRWFVTKKGL